MAIPHSSESGTIKTIDAFKVQMNMQAEYQMQQIWQNG
jgi:hypothetical protein